VQRAGGVQIPARLPHRDHAQRQEQEHVDGDFLVKGRLGLLEKR
jgi:hypothetical protein